MPMGTKLNPAELLYVGLDTHKRTHAAWAQNCFGEKYLSQEIENTMEGFGLLAQKVQRLSEKLGLKPVFGLEDTGGSGHALACYLTEKDNLVKTVNPVLVHRLRSKTTHPEKSDILDAKGVAKVLILEGIDKLPSYKISKRSTIANDLRGLLNDRSYLVKEQTRIKNHLHVLLPQGHGLEYNSKFGSIFSLKALSYWIEHPCADNVIKAANQGCNDRGDKSDSDGMPNILPNQIKRKAKRLLALYSEIKEIEAEMTQIVKQYDSPLQTMKGFGPVATAGVLAEIKDIARFRSAPSLAKYAGTLPKENSSAGSHHVHKSKSGNRRLNTYLHRVALSQISRYGDPKGKEYYQKKIAEGKTKSRALTCLKRRLVDIIFMMLKNNTAYDSSLH
jgi:transposase